MMQELEQGAKIAIFVLIMCLISAGLACVPLYLGQGFLPWFFGFLALQVALITYKSYWLDIRTTNRALKTYEEQLNLALDEYKKLPFKKYIQTFNCSSCMKPTQVQIDLDGDLEYKCAHCNTQHAIYVDISTAVITNPIVMSSHIDPE